MKLIGLTGKARSGKDTVGAYLCKQRGFVRTAFADPVKEAVRYIFGLSYKQTWGDELKEVPVEPWGITPRRMMQLLGTECVKPHFGDDIWCKRWKLTYDQLDGDNVVVTDVRFDHEAAFLRNLGAIIVEVYRGEALTGEAAAHSSEAGLSLPPDFTVFNNGSFEDLYRAIDEVLK